MASKGYNFTNLHGLLDGSVTVSLRYI